MPAKGRMQFSAARKVTVGMTSHRYHRSCVTAFVANQAAGAQAPERQMGIQPQRRSQELLSIGSKTCVRVPDIMYLLVPEARSYSYRANTHYR